MFSRLMPPIFIYASSSGEWPDLNLKVDLLGNLEELFFYRGVNTVNT